ncbi:MAG: signal peptide peptidase SppA [Desulfobacterales bacterium]|nr:signal peptide peptidase SppA [Desulfobacterales bacterium]
MFSRKHPYLFFMLSFTAMICVFVFMLSLIAMFSSNTVDFEFGEKVGIIEINGMILNCKEITQDLKRFREDDTIKAIVLRIDSPGGAVAPSQEIYQEVKKTCYKKKVIVSMGALAASGGYYVASAADGIVASPGTITGSIGVIMGYTNFEELLKKVGLYPVVIKSGQYKDLGSMYREMTEQERQILQGFVEKIHGQFIRDVAEARKLEINKVKELADGRIYTGEEAFNLGLIDRLGNFQDAIEWAALLSGIEGKISTVYSREDRLSWVDYLIGSAVGTFIEKINNATHIVTPTL